MFLISPNLNILLLIDFILFAFFIYSLPTIYKISNEWDIYSTDEKQYNLEKKTYLINTIVKYFFILKIITFPFFIYTIDQLSIKIPGAMCATGVFSSSIFGYPTLFAEIICIFSFGLLLSLQYENNKYENLPYTKRIFTLLIFIILIFITEFILKILFFSNLDPTKITTCCGTVFTDESTSIYSTIIKPKNLLILFYSNFILILFSYFKKNNYLYIILNITFLIFAIISLTYFFSSYIYELPTHHCPFCLLQKDYQYIGYLIYIFLFSGTFSGIYYGFLNTFIKENNIFLRRISLLMLILYTISVTSYPIIYYLKNRVWL